MVMIMVQQKHNHEWLELWEERGRAVCGVLGDMVPPGGVIPFSWDNYILPGACALAFGPRGSRTNWLYMTLGLTQPVEKSNQAGGWEFCVRTKDSVTWVYQLLYDLLTFYLSEGGKVARGLCLPLAFFLNSSGDICVGLTDDTTGLNVVGEVRGLYLWDDYERLEFIVSSGKFGLLTAIGVTAEEDRLAQDTTPPHLLLLLAEMGIDQVLDPFRESVVQRPDFNAKWNIIRELSHDEVVRQLWSYR